MIMAEPQRLEQVFINLLVNARDAIEKKWESNGYKCEDDRITVKTEKEGQTVVVKLDDTGVGIPANELSTVWDGFTQMADPLLVECVDTFRAANFIFGRYNEAFAVLLGDTILESASPVTRPLIIPSRCKPPEKLRSPVIVVP